MPRIYIGLLFIALRLEQGMARIGAFCFPGTGHINPMTALARRLQERGHQVVIFGIADTETRVRAAGIEFCLIGESDYPQGTLQKLDQRLGKLKGLDTFHGSLRGFELPLR